MEDNITAMDKIKGRAYFIYKFMMKGFDYTLINYALVENWLDADMFLAEFSQDCKLIPRSRDISMNPIIKFAQLLSRNMSFITTDISDNMIKLRYRGAQVRYKFVDSMSLIITAVGVTEQFYEEQYKDIAVKGETVLDIGAMIGDSAIYFALNGAKRVVALEPYPYSFTLAKENIALNKMNDKITLVNAACGADNKTVIIDPKFKNSNKDGIRKFSKGRKIEVIRLDQIIRRYHLNNAIMKMDCEGAEYGIILESSNETLRKFKTMVIEYHFGFRNIEKKLKDAGFKVRHTGSFYLSNTNDKHRVLCGLLYADRT